MKTITWWGLKDRVFHLQARVVEGLLEIHRAVYRHARDVHVEALLREYGHMDYLARVADELDAAVRRGQLRVKLLPPLQLAMQREKKQSDRAQAPADEKVEEVEIRLFDLLNRPISKAPYEVTAGGFSKRGIAEDAMIKFQNVDGAKSAMCAGRGRSNGGRDRHETQMPR